MNDVYDVVLMFQITGGPTSSVSFSPQVLFYFYVLEFFYI